MSTNIKTIVQEDVLVNQEDIGLPDRNAKIAELAYFKAEKRGFEPGHEMEDWLDAERECTQL
jgi:hypothetical protein